MSERSEPAAPRGRPGGEESGRDRPATHRAARRAPLRQSAAARPIPRRPWWWSGRAAAPAAPPHRLPARALIRVPSRPAPLRPTPAVLTAAAAVVVYALVAGGFRHLTIPAEIATFVPGATVTHLALRRDRHRPSAPGHLDGRGVAVWGVLLVVFGVWELYADLRGSTPDHPTLSILMGPMLADPLHRAAGYLLWLATGVWLVRR